MHKSGISYAEWKKKAADAGRPARDSCVNCKFELTCGYSHLANTGQRDDEFSFGPCILGERSFDAGPFFQPKTVAPGAQK